MSINDGHIEMTLNSPITEEQLDAITDVDFEHTNRIWFHTKHGKDVEFAKVVRCKDCKFFREHLSMNCVYHVSAVRENWFCSQGRVKE